MKVNERSMKINEKWLSIPWQVNEIPWQVLVFSIRGLLDQGSSRSEWGVWQSGVIWVPVSLGLKSGIALSSPDCRPLQRHIHRTFLYGWLVLLVADDGTADGQCHVSILTKSLRMNPNPRSSDGLFCQNRTRGPSKSERGGARLLVRCQFATARVGWKSVRPYTAPLVFRGGGCRVANSANIP